jgi:hypothetical protein
MGSIPNDSLQWQVCQANFAIWAILTSASLTPSFVLQPCLNSTPLYLYHIETLNMVSVLVQMYWIYAFLELDFSGYWRWNSWIISEVLRRLATGSQVLLLTSYPCYWTRNSNFLQMILESRIFETSNSSCPLISTRGGGTWNLPGIDDSLYGSSKEIWNTGWFFIEGSKSRRNAASLICLITEKSPRQRKSSLSHGRLVLRLQQSSHILSPMLIIGCAFRDLSTLSFYQSWGSRSLSFISIWISDNRIARSPAVGFSTLLKSY